MSSSCSWTSSSSPVSGSALESVACPAGANDACSVYWAASESDPAVWLGFMAVAGGVGLGEALALFSNCPGPAERHVCMYVCM